MKKIMLYNSLTGAKEEFKPSESDKVKMYVCGPTTYNYIHLGNARPLVVFDAIRRYLKYLGFDVNFVQNFTDIDDKIINRAREESADALELSARFIREYHQDAKELNILPADHHPKVSGHINDIISFIEVLLAKGFAYVTAKGVYFEVRRFPSYGKLSGRSVDELRTGARINVDPLKRDPLDFALWKVSLPGELSWESPWGRGRPGWHIECSAMAIKYLGNTLDIHGGGQDLIFPHHENELAQAEALTGESFARYWVHNGFIMTDKEKMSKSSGNFFLLRDILQKFSGDVIRFFLLSTHYRSPLDFEVERFEESKRALARLKGTIKILDQLLENPRVAHEGDYDFGVYVNGTRSAFEEAMNDDFNTALALATLFNLSHEINTYINQNNTGGNPVLLKAAKSLLQELGTGVLGIVLESPQVLSDRGPQLENLINILLDLRQEARLRRDWAAADGIRDKLKDIGITLEDTPAGTRWSIN